MKNGVKIVGIPNLAATVPADASALYARNVLNFLALSLNVNTSRYNRQYAIIYTEPYWTPDGVSRTLELYEKTLDPTGLAIAQYSSKTYGAAIGFGVPITETATSVGAPVVPDAPSLRPTAPTQSVPFRVPAVRALTNGPSIARALRPLRRRVPSQFGFTYDELATVEAIARSATTRQVVRLI